MGVAAPRPGRTRSHSRQRPPDQSTIGWPHSPNSSTRGIGARALSPQAGDSGDRTSRRPQLRHPLLDLPNRHRLRSDRNHRPRIIVRNAPVLGHRLRKFASCSRLSKRTASGRGSNRDASHHHESNPNASYRRELRKRAWHRRGSKRLASRRHGSSPKASKRSGSNRSAPSHQKSSSPRCCRRHNVMLLCARQRGVGRTARRPPRPLMHRDALSRACRISLETLRRAVPSQGRTMKNPPTRRCSPVVAGPSLFCGWPR